MELAELKEFLDEKVEQYNRPDFIENDPLQILHRFSRREDIEIAGFLTATISWGNRKAIISSAEKILDYLDHSPYDFVSNFQPSDLEKLQGQSVHRTFNGDDLVCFLKSLQRVYRHHDSMESLFLPKHEELDFYHPIERFRNFFVECDVLPRTQKHISSTYKNSSAKRLMMFLRWMVRNDGKNVDFGIWTGISPAMLSIPLDVHTGNISRKLRMLTRKQNDWTAVSELDKYVRQLDALDPAKYDFALFGLGVSGDFK